MTDSYANLIYIYKLICKFIFMHVILDAIGSQNPGHFDLYFHLLDRQTYISNKLLENVG